MSKNTSNFSLSAIIGQLSEIWKTLIPGIFISLGGAGFTLLVARLTGNPVWKLSTDPADVEQYPLYIGMLSNWGVILWTAAATICLFSAVILKHQKAPDGTFNFLAVSGIFSLTLGLDDLYMMHDRLLPKLFHISEIFFYILYFLSLLIYLGYFASQILKYNYILLMISLLLFIVSRPAFILFRRFGIFTNLADMFKYFGIVFWLAFFYRTALHEMNVLADPHKSTRLTSD